MRFWNPLPVEGLVALLRELPLPEGARVLDYGCGEGEVLRELVGAHAARVSGVDRSPAAIASCWDRYEDEYDVNMRVYLARHPEDPNATAFEQRRSTWRAMYLAHARGTLGFAVYQARLVRR
jgi:cyclopropane fatty-acyl-phospholipid synthase-like methyltransferase